MKELGATDKALARPAALFGARPATDTHADGSFMSNSLAWEEALWLLFLIPFKEGEGRDRIAPTPQATYQRRAGIITVSGGSQLPGLSPSCREEHKSQPAPCTAGML